MAARSIGSGTISFGLVSIPVRLYVATSSESLSFNMLHEPCRSRIKQQLFCPTCERVVERSEIVKGYQFAKDQYVLFADDELKALEAAGQSLDRHPGVRAAREGRPDLLRERALPRTRQGRREGVSPARAVDARHRQGRGRAVDEPRQGAHRADPRARRRARDARALLRRRGAEPRRDRRRSGGAGRRAPPRSSWRGS